MALRVYARKMAGGHGHEHIAEVKWENDVTAATGKSSRANMVTWLDEDEAKHRAYVLDGLGNKAYIGSRHPAGSAAFNQTYADNTWTDNLLALDTYV